MKVKMIIGYGANDLNDKIDQFLSENWSYEICFTNYAIESPKKHIALIYYER